MIIVIPPEDIVRIIEKHLREEFGIRSGEMDVMGQGDDLNSLEDIHVQVTTD